MSKDSRKLIIEKTKAKKTSKKAEIIEPIKLKTNKQNQFVAFFKPETFLDKTPEQIEKIMNLVFDKFDEFGVEITGSAHFPGSAINEFSIMDRHYGVINKLSKSASKILTRVEKENVLKTLGINTEIKILGGHEAHTISGMNETDFDKYWLESPSTKIKSGFYVREMKVKNETVVVVNGFHPNQLLHYTHVEHEVIMMTVASNKAWKEVREDMIGESFPDKAKPRSIRGTLFNNPGEYGFERIGIDNNVIHLSAGPTEGLFEMDNFLNNAFGIDIIKEEALLALRLKNEGLSEKDIRKIMSSKKVHDELEHKDTDYAVTFIKGLNLSEL
ncbi:hypothetical protein BH10PAT1_BH10PAT1_2820 [soil metagenome]